MQRLRQVNKIGCGNVFHLLLSDILEIVFSLSLQSLEELSSNAACLKRYISYQSLEIGYVYTYE